MMLEQIFSIANRYALTEVNLKASWIAFAFSTPRESTRPKTMTDSKVLQMRFSTQPS
jgi:hypothetical protein